jgi:hypothetical protein
MNKTILTLAALATIGTAALAPTSASAFGLASFAKHLPSLNIKISAPAGHLAKVTRTDIKQAIQIGEHLASRAHAVRAPIHFAYRPAWHRPGFVHSVGYPVYQAPVQIAAAPAYRSAMQAPVNGMNVIMVAVPNGQYSMTGEGQWTEQTGDGKTFQFTEANRDAASVTLTDASRGVALTLDLSQREVFYADRNGPKRPLFPIVNASAK